LFEYDPTIKLRTKLAGQPDEYRTAIRPNPFQEAITKMKGGCRIALSFYQFAFELLHYWPFDLAKIRIKCIAKFELLAVDAKSIATS
jgi:hypothetical protein